MAEQFSAKEVALEYKTDARTLRKFLREHLGEGKAVVGQGGRYSFTKSEVKKMRKAFDAWAAGGANTLKTTKKAPTQKEIDRTTEEVDLDDDGEVVDLEELEGPDEDDLDDEDIELLDDED
jgi:hypothetical protein